MDFRSDNVHVAADPILKAILEANQGTISSYGEDEITHKAYDLLSEVFNREIVSFFVSTGTAANALCLSAITPPYGSTFCGFESHIYLEECNAPEFFTGGSKLFPIETDSGKISPKKLKNALANHPKEKSDISLSSLSLAQATECGTVYKLEEINKLTRIGKDNNLNIHLDGARFANAIVHLNSMADDASWKTGVDIMSFGTTKNGTLSAEAILVFNEAIGKNLPHNIKRSGHLLSKMRYLAIQIIAYLQNNLWLELAKKSNIAAEKLSNELKTYKYIEMPWQNDINELFLIIPSEFDNYLIKSGLKYNYWTKKSLEKKYQHENYRFIRLVTSFATPESELNQFLELCEKFK